MLFLFLSIAALFAGVAIVPFTRRWPAIMAGIDGFAIVGVGGILVLHLMPYSFERAGWWAIVACAVGLVIPYFFERGHSADTPSKDNRMLLLAAVGLSVHAFLDGSALSTHGLEAKTTANALIAGVLIHRLPMGLVLGMIATEDKPNQPWLAASLVSVGTIGGYAVGVDALPNLSAVSMALFQALIAGSLAHVVYAHTPGGMGTNPGTRRPMLIGMALGGLLLVALWGGI
jgi:zinc transporter ZupT